MSELQNHRQEYHRNNDPFLFDLALDLHNLGTIWKISSFRDFSISILPFPTGDRTNGSNRTNQDRASMIPKIPSPVVWDPESWREGRHLTTKALRDYHLMIYWRICGRYSFKSPFFTIAFPYRLCDLGSSSLDSPVFPADPTTSQNRTSMTPKRPHLDPPGRRWGGLEGPQDPHHCLLEGVYDFLGVWQSRSICHLSIGRSIGDIPFPRIDSLTSDGTGPSYTKDSGSDHRFGPMQDLGDH